MVNKCFKNVGLFLAIFFHQSLALNDTEKSQSESFVVSANYDVQSDQPKPNSIQDDSQNFVPSNNYQPYAYAENFVNKNYQDYSESDRPNTQEQQERHVESMQASQPNNDYSEKLPTNYNGNSEMLSTPSEWKPHFNTNPCTKHEMHSHGRSENFVPQSYSGYYAGQSESTSPVQHYQETQESSLNRNEIINPMQITSYQSYSPRLSYDDHNTGYQEHNNFENSVYGSISKEGNQDTQWTSSNRKISNDRNYESQTKWSAAKQGSEDFNDSQKPNVVELQEMINKIVKGNSKVHQVLKVPAVYEIHLQEEEQPAGHPQMVPNAFHVPLPQGSTQKWQPHQSLGPAQWGKRKPPGNPRSSRTPSRGGPPGMKTWNLPSKIKYFNKRDRVNDSPELSFGKFAYPQPFSPTAKESPLRQWQSNRNFNRVLPTGSPVYGSVSVPMTPGSTEVTFLDNGVNFGHRNAFDTTLLNSPKVMPDLSNYYAKKKELENDSFQGSNSNENTYRRDSTEGTRINLKRNYRTKLRNREERNLFPFNNLNYIIYVREKSRG